MDHSFCPGSKLLRQPAPEEHFCPTCGAEVEIWTDELKGTCPSCRSTVYRDAAMGCLDWCKYGKDCVGEAVYEKFMKNKAVGVKKRLLEILEDHFGSDTRRIDHAKQVLRFAEELLEEEQAEWHIVVPASILHDVGIRAAEEKYASSDGKFQEQEGPSIVRQMLLKLGFKMEDIDEICGIVAHHHSPGVVDTRNFEVLYDADLLVNLSEKERKSTSEEISGLIDRSFLTETGKKIALRELVGQEIYTRR